MKLAEVCQWLIYGIKGTPIAGVNILTGETQVKVRLLG